MSSSPTPTIPTSRLSQAPVVYEFPEPAAPGDDPFALRDECKDPVTDGIPADLPPVVSPDDDTGSRVHPDTLGHR